MEVGFLGLGRMGTPMAANLIRAGYKLTVYNRTDRPSPLKELGAKFASSPREVAEASSVIISMLADDLAVEEIFFGGQGAMKGLSSGKIIVDMSTVSPSTALKLAGEAEKAGAHSLDAPVAGSVKPAMEGTLSIMVGGEREIFEQVLPLLSTMGQKVIYMGDHGKGLAAKISINVLLGLTTVALAESAALAKNAGVPVDSFLELVGSSAVGSSPYIKTKLPLLEQGEYPVAFSLDHIYKDMGFALNEAYRLNVGMPAAMAALTCFAQARAKGWGNEDLMAVARLWGL